MGDLFVEAGDLDLYVFIRADIIRGGAIVLSQPVQKMSVDVISHAEDEYPGPDPVLVLHIVQNVLNTGNSHRGQPIGQKDDKRRFALRTDLLKPG